MKNETPTKIDEVDAKTGRTVKGMTTVLGLSTLAALIAMGIAFAFMTG